jgi:hypothetical protein
LASSITGSSVSRAGGGGGGLSSGASAAGGTGGGGAGANSSTSTLGVSAGGSGVVVIAYPNTFADLNVGAGLTYTLSTASRSGYKVYTFTAGTGSITI